MFPMSAPQKNSHTHSYCGSNKKTQNFYCSNKLVKLEDQIEHFDMPEKDIRALLLVATNKLS